MAVAVWGANRPGKQHSLARRYGCRAADPETIEKAPPRMRWRGPPDRAARTPLAHAQRPAARSATEPDTRLRSRCPGPTCAQGAPGWCPFSVVRDFYARGQGPRKGFLVSNFTMFHVSTKCPQPAGSYPPQAQNPPQQIHRQQAVPAPASYSGASPKLPTGARAGTVPGEQRGARR